MVIVRGWVQCAWNFFAEELSAVPTAELAVRLEEARRQASELSAQVERLPGRVE
jgi:hypothetical protein